MRYSTAQRQEGREREGEMRKNRMPIHDPTHLLNHWTCECWKKLFCAYQSSNNCSYHVAKEHFFGSWKLFSPFYLHTLRAKNCNQHGKIFSHNFECVPIIIMGRFRGHNDPLIVARWRFFSVLWFTKWRVLRRKAKIGKMLSIVIKNCDFDSVSECCMILCEESHWQITSSSNLQCWFYFSHSFSLSIQMREQGRDIDVNFLHNQFD